MTAGRRKGPVDGTGRRGGGQARAASSAQGTTDGYDSINPFVAFSAQSYATFLDIYPDPGPVRRELRVGRRLGGELGDLARRAHLDLQAQAGRRVVGRHAADGRGRRLDRRDDPQVREGPDRQPGALPLERREPRGPRPEHARHHVRAARGQRPPAAPAVLHPPQARLGEVRGRRRQGARSSTSPRTTSRSSPEASTCSRSTTRRGRRSSSGTLASTARRRTRTPSGSSGSPTPTRC